MNNPPRCTVLPLPHDQVSFSIDDREVTRWHFGRDAERPYFYPLVSPHGGSVTRMGHPGAPNHDHHRSVWFAHHSVTGVDFWSNNTDARIRQREWMCYQSGDEAVMAVLLDWIDGHDPQPLMTQELVVAVRPEADRNWLMELQCRFKPRAETLTLQKTNFGMIAVRVAEHISAFFGNGELTGADGKRSERELFGEPNTWIDYSGTNHAGEPEGITLFNHPDNLDAAPRWHVREDGWMGPSLCRERDVVIERARPLQLRYLIHVHGDSFGQEHRRAERLLAQFGKRGAFRVTPSRKRHTAYEANRIPTDQ